MGTNEDQALWDCNKSSKKDLSWDITSFEIERG